MNRRSLICAVILCLLPAATSADASVSTMPAARCTDASIAAYQQLQAVSAVQTRQLAALRRASQRLHGLITQTALQGRSFASLAADETELNARTTAIVASYANLTNILTTTSTNCSAPAPLGAGPALTSLRAQVASVDAWYTDHLAPDLAATR